MDRPERALAALLLLAPLTAQAYPSMIRHGYTGCAECHLDPSGAGALTPYGRAQSSVLLSTPWQKRDADWQPGKSVDFLFGALKLPDGLVLQADSRTLVIPEPGNVRVIGMQDDLRAGVDLGKLVAYASIGWVSAGAYKAEITSSKSGSNLVSREHWVGVQPTEGLLIRAGSMNLPFGIRSEEHVLFAENVTHTDLNDGQEYGLDAYYETGDVRMEAMAVAGDFQVSPAIYRQHGYVATFGWGPRPKLDLGISSLALDVGADVVTRSPLLRTAQAAYVRWSPAQPVAVLGEAGFLDGFSKGAATPGGYGSLQVDLEPVQGLHFKGTGEACNDGSSPGAAPATRGWFATQWFVAPHFDVRADAMYGTLYCTPGVPPTFMAMVQAHAWL